MSYYSIKNLVETLSEIDGFLNKSVIQILTEVEETFLKNLFTNISINKNYLNHPLKLTIFSILQKLEFFTQQKINY